MAGRRFRWGTDFSGSIGGFVSVVAAFSLAELVPVSTFPAFTGGTSMALASMVCGGFLAGAVAGLTGGSRITGASDFPDFRSADFEDFAAGFAAGFACFDPVAFVFRVANCP